MEPVLDVDIIDGQKGALANWDILNIFHNNWIHDGGDRTFLPSDFPSLDEFNDFVTRVRRYWIAPGINGIVGDGVTDDTDAIQAVLDSCLAGYRVIVDRGTYLVTDQGSGFCLDISTKIGIGILGPVHGKANPSGSGGSATFFTTSTGTKVFKCEAAALNHYGPHVENIRIEDRAGNSTCFSLLDYNNYTFRCVTFHGNGGTTTGTGLKIDATEDASYGDIDDCQFHHHLIGLSTHGSAGVSIKGGYAQSSTTNHVLFDLQNGSSACSVVGTKFEGGLGAVSGAVGIQVNTTSDDQIVACNFEGCKTGINLVAQGGPTPTGTQIHACSFTGTNGTETAIVIGANRIRDQIIGCRFSNLATNLTDNGTDTIIIGTRPDGLRTGEFMRIGGVYFGEGTAAPPDPVAKSLPNGSIYHRSGTGVYALWNATWVLLRTPIPVVSNPVPSGFILGTIIQKVTAYEADGVTIVGYIPVYDQITGISTARFLKAVANPGFSFSNLITTAFAANAYLPAVGDFIVIGGGYQLPSASATVTCSDTRGNTYTVERVDNRTTVGSSAHSFIISAKVTTAFLDGDVITIHFSTPVNSPAAVCHGYTGMHPSSRVDQALGATGSNTSPSSGAATTTVDHELLYEALYYDASTPDFTRGTGWTVLREHDNSGGGGVAQLAIQARYEDIGTFTADGTFGSSWPWAASLVTFKKD